MQAIPEEYYPLINTGPLSEIKSGKLADNLRRLWNSFSKKETIAGVSRNSPLYHSIREQITKQDAAEIIKNIYIELKTRKHTTKYAKNIIKMVERRLC